MHHILLLYKFESLQITLLEGIIAFYKHRPELLEDQSYALANRLAKEIYIMKRLASLPIDEVDAIYDRHAKILSYEFSYTESEKFREDAEYIARLFRRFEI